MNQEQSFRQDPRTGAYGRWDENFEDRMNKTERVVHKAFDWSEGQKVQFRALWRLRCLLNGATEEQEIRQHASEIATALPATFASTIHSSEPITADRILAAAENALPIPDDVPEILQAMHQYRLQHGNPHFKGIDRTPESTLFLGMMYQQMKYVLDEQQQRDFCHLIMLMNDMHRMVAERGGASPGETAFFYDALETFTKDLPLQVRDKFVTVIAWVRDYIGFLLSTFVRDGYTGTNTYYQETLGFVTTPAPAEGDDDPMDEESRQVFLRCEEILQNAIGSFTATFDLILHDIYRQQT